MIINTNNLTQAQLLALNKEIVAKAGPVAPGRDEVHIDVFLTELLLAVMQDPMGFVADMVAPETPVGKQSGKIGVIDRKSYTRDMAEPRSDGAEPAGAGYKATSVSFDAEVHGIHIDIGDQTRANYDNPFDADDDATFVLAELMKINREINFSNTALKSSAWASSVKGAASDAANFDPSSTTPADRNMMYLTSDTAAPIKMIKALKRHVMLRGGRKPHALAVGKELCDGLCEQADIVGRINRGQTAGQPALATAVDLARLFELQWVWPMEGIYNKANEGATSADYDWIGDAQSALLVYVNPMGGGLRMPQGMRTLTWSGYLGATENGLRMQKYRMQHLASDRAEAEAAYDHVIMDNGMGLFLEDMVE